MDLVRSWLGQALRATGAAVVVPLAILVALSLSTVGGGGLSGVGALSQIVSGPEAPGASLVLDDGGDEIAEAVEELAAADPLGGVGGSGGGSDGPGTGGGPPGGGGTGGSDDGTGPLGGVNEPKPPGGGGEPKPPGGGGGGGGGGNPPPPEPPQPQRLVDEVGDTVNDVASQTPVGPTVEEAIDGLLETCGQLNCP